MSKLSQKTAKRSFLQPLGSPDIPKSPAPRRAVRDDAVRGGPLQQATSGRKSPSQAAAHYE